PTAVIEAPSAPGITLAQGKKYYRAGMKAFGKQNYKLAFKLLKKSLELKEVHKAAYYYAETYATIGVIYQFYAHKVKNHDQRALEYYRKALKIDPQTKAAKSHYKKLLAKVARENKANAKHKPKA